MSQESTDGIKIRYFDREDLDLVDLLSKAGYRYRCLKKMFICFLCPKCLGDDHESCYNTAHYQYCSCPCEFRGISKDEKLKGTEGFESG